VKRTLNFTPSPNTYALVFFLLAGSLLIIADLVSDRAFEEIVKLVTLAGAVFLVGGVMQKKANTLEAKTDGQTKQLDNIQHAVNGKLEARFTSIEGRFTSMEGRLDEIVDMLTAPKS
jgi:chromosome segregation ATPase